MSEKTITERYQAAQRLLTSNTRGAVLNGHPAIKWQGHSLQYIRQVRTGDKIGELLVTVDTKTGQEQTGPVESGPEDSGANKGRSLSYDGKWELVTRDHNLWLLQAGEKDRQLTFDGREGCEYGTYLDIYSQVTTKLTGAKMGPAALFSPDSRYFITYRSDLTQVKTLPVVQCWGDEGEKLRPLVHEYPCPFAVDSNEQMPVTELFLGDTVTGSLRKLDIPPYVMPVFMTDAKAFAKWLEDSSGFYCTWYDRSCTEGRLYLVNAAEGTARLYVKEKADTFHNLGAFNLLDGYGAYQFSNFITEDGREAFWQSERSGYAHLYRYDSEGNCLGDLFGDSNETLIVQKLIRLDQNQGKLYFMANNIADCSDPLFYSLYVIGLDGSGLIRLTPEDGNHQISMGEDAFVDTWSRIDLPPVTNLRGLDGGLIRELEKADITSLMEKGYIFPEPFRVKADDGITDLCGVMVCPADFDPNKTYPVIDYVYGGAQLYNVPRDFTWDNVQNREIMGGLQEFAQLGFVGLIIDGRGTPGRGKAFHDYSYKNIHGCAGLDDHPGAIGRLKEQYPFLDLDRVGIWGNSGGGYATVSALFKYGDLYKVGVASSGNYDQRMYENSWTERYYGAYEPEVYKHGDITALAGQLKGKLLLAVGGVDDNVTIWQTFRLCDELTRHNKDYDLMVLPRVNHNVPSDPYFMRRKLDYFVKHLMGQEPPKEFEL